jgi:hypothetical protein
MKTCKIPECSFVLYSKGFCKKHYDKNRRHGDPLFEEIIEKGTPCPINNCGNPIWANGMCGKHYRRMQRHGDPLYVNPKCNREPGNKWTYEKALANTARWKRDNRKEYNAYLAESKAKTKQATPKWSDRKVVAAIYKNCPDGQQVDHIIPITNELVCGLNVACNMQYLSNFDNNSKNNKFDGTYENESWRKDLNKSA